MIKIDEQIKQEAIVMYVRGASLREVADSVGVSHGSVSSWLDKYGITKRRRAHPIIVKRKKTKSQRFWDIVNKKSGKYSPHAIGQCWEWKGGTTGAGYGRFYYEYAHRYSWRLHHGTKIPAGLHVMHKCDNPPCVNPAHLRLGTPKENTRDAIEKGRRPGKRAPLVNS